MTNRTGVIVIEGTAADCPCQDSFAQVVGRVAGRVWGAEHILSAHVVGPGASLAARVGELATREVDRIVILPAALHPDGHLLHCAQTTLRECRSLYPNVSLHLEEPRPGHSSFEDNLVERIWPMFAAERDQPPTGPEIEQRSHAIIDRRLARCAWPDAATRSVVRRVIHANADFSFAESLRIHPEAVSRGVAALRAGSPVICDVQMVRQGITKCGPQALCAIREPAVAELAKANGTTRSAAAMEHFRDRLDGAVVAVGNAPTALWKLIAMAHEENGPRPALVVGMPVGFVGALESKLALTRSDLCYITNVSPRGGSPAAAAVMNALGLLASSSE